MIPKSQRRLSATQYETSFLAVYNHMRELMLALPKRRQKSIANPIMEAMNEAYQAIMDIAEKPVRGRKDMAQVRYDAIVRAQQVILKIQKPLYVYWVICDKSRTTQRTHLCQQFDYVLSLLHGIQCKSTVYNPETDAGVMRLVYFTNDEINKAEFLSKIRDLLIYTHDKVTRMPKTWRDADGDLLEKFVADAFFHAVFGNKCHPDQDKEQAEIRRKNFSAALTALKAMNRPMISCFAGLGLSERELLEWSDLLVDSIKLLSAVMASDKGRRKET